MPSITELGRPGASPGGWAVCPPSGWRLMTAGLCLLHRARTLEFRAISLSLDGEPLRANTDFFYRLAASESGIVSPPSDRQTGGFCGQDHVFPSGGALKRHACDQSSWEQKLSPPPT